MGYLPFVGYNYGAGKMKRVRDSFWFTTISSTIFGLALTIPFWMFGSGFMRVFTSDEKIIELGVHCLKIYVFCLPVSPGLAIYGYFNISGHRKSDFCHVLKSWAGKGFSLFRQSSYSKSCLISMGLFGLQVAADYMAVVLCILLALPMIKKISKSVAMAHDGKEEKSNE